MANTALWRSNAPNNRDNAEDCVLISRNGLLDNGCDKTNKIICQAKTRFTHSSYFEIQSNRLQMSSSNTPKCLSTTTARQFSSALQCGMHCAAQNLASCYAFYYNEINGLCVFVPYTDVMLFAEKQEHWIKYASSP